jgi:beta-galactosidase GanA
LVTLLKELAKRGQASCRNHTRKAVAKFEELLHMVGSKVHKHETVFRTLIPAMMKGELTLQYLATKVSTKVMPPFF